MDFEPHGRRAVALAIGVVVVVVDWTTAGISIGILFVIPIILASRSRSPLEVLITGGLSLAAFGAAIQFGAQPTFPPVVFISNRVFTLFVIVSATAVSLILQRDRLERKQAELLAAARAELNRLMLAVVAHDLRSPLGSAAQAVEYVIGSIDDGAPLDRDLLEHVDGRIRRGLLASDLVLDVVREDIGRLDQGPAATEQAGIRLINALEEEVRSFTAEAQALGKPITCTWRDVDSVGHVNPVIARQVFSILLDNSLVHAAAGPITVTGEHSGDWYLVTVRDAGVDADSRTRPGSSGRVGRYGGAGLGLQLARMLIAGQGGDLDVTPGSAGTVARLRVRSGWA